MPEGKTPLAVGIDIGGTFTDIVLHTPEGLRVHKVPSTPHDPSQAFLRGLEELGVPTDARHVHGSTVATNAVLERRGAAAALLTTAGFRDVLELGRQTRQGLYSLHPTRAEPLIPRTRCFEVAGRIDRYGRELLPLDEEGLARALVAIREAGIESVAICFLFSFANPQHEHRAGERARDLGLSVSLSCEILPEYREYERAGTTAANAYVAPLMDRYLGRLQQLLDGRAATAGTPRGSLQVMQSNGGVISVATARKEAVRTVLSGPAGGVVGAGQVAAAACITRIITFDMGGTSTDVSLAEGEPQAAHAGSIAGLPLRIPMLEIHTVGAGGGSLARAAADGTLRVGPESAGADPGPAAYGRGTRATVTDANLVLGRYYLPAFLEGRMTLYPERSLAAVTRLGEELGLSPEETAEGIESVVNAQMSRAIRRVSVERGHDPRRFTLVAFGGGGALHACALAEELAIPQVLVPRYPGLLSALGMLLTDLRKEVSRTVMTPLDGDLAALERCFHELEMQAVRELESEGVTPAEIRTERWVDLRYLGQSHELTVPAPAMEEGPLLQALAREHTRRFGYAGDSVAGELVNLRVRAVGIQPRPALPMEEERDRSAPEKLDHQEVRYRGERLRVPIIPRERLLPGHRLAGPVIMPQGDTTTWLPPAWRLRVDGGYNLILQPSYGGSEKPG